MGLKPYLGKTVPDAAMFSSHISGDAGAVSSNNTYASKAGLEILAKGGNAFDAAVAVSLALGVVEPYMSGIGGGCFSVIYDASQRQYHSYDARGTAPRKAYRDMFLGSDGEPDQNLTEFSGLPVATPTMYRYYDELLQQHGTMSLKDVSQPAIRLAREGFRASFMYCMGTNTTHAEHNTREYEDFSKLYMNNGNGRQYGDYITNHDLADTLTQVAEKGPEWFYHGPIGEELVRVVQKHGGLLEKEDLYQTAVHHRKPVRGTYRGYDIISMAPPSSGGTHLIQMLNILENYDLKSLGHNSAESIHLIAETLKIMFADRSVAMGDPAFVSVNMDHLLSKEYAKELAASINPDKAQDYAPTPGIEAKDYPGCTTHFCVQDRYGNMISQTQTIRNWWGCGIVVPGRGFVLNNNLADFSAKSGVKTTQGLSYGTANAVSPGKTPLSSMSPTIVAKDGKPFLTVGSAGGPRIITSVLQTILNVIDYGMSMNRALLHSQIATLSFNQGLELEDGVSADTIRLLTEKGHNLLPYESHAALKALPNGILYSGNRFFPGGTNRADGGGGVLFSDGGICLDGFVFC